MQKYIAKNSGEVSIVQAQGRNQKYQNRPERQTSNKKAGLSIYRNTN